MNPNADTIFTPDKDFKELEKAYAHVFNGLIDAQKEAANLRADKAALFEENQRLNDTLTKAKEECNVYAFQVAEAFDRTDADRQEIAALRQEVAAGDIALKAFIRGLVGLGAEAEKTAREILTQAREAGEF